MKWVTRENAAVDRVACPWLINRFIDPEAEFIYVNKDEVLEVAEREGAHSYDAPGAKYTHRDGKCSFEALVEDFILTEVGLVPIVGVHAKKNPEGGEGRRAGRYVPKTADADSVTVRLPDGEEVMAHLSAYDGALSLKHLTESGEPHYEALPLTRLQRNPNKRGFRWYGSYKLPGSLGGKEISVRHHQNAEDDRRGLNRTENLRPIPESSPDFARLRVLRPDAESINGGIEDSLFINRASAKGWRRQMVDLLGHARLVNALTLARCRARLPVEAVA